MNESARQGLDAYRGYSRTKRAKDDKESVNRLELWGTAEAAQELAEFMARYEPWFAREAKKALGKVRKAARGAVELAYGEPLDLANRVCDASLV